MAHLRLEISNDSSDTDSASTTANVQYVSAEQKIPLVHVSPSTRCKSKRKKKRWREAYAKERTFVAFIPSCYRNTRHTSAGRKQVLLLRTAASATN